MSMLLAGPWLGEFGWEVAVWTPLVRKHSRKFDKTIIVCRKGHEYLYEDFTPTFILHDKKGLPDRWLLDGKKVSMPHKILDIYPDATICRPREKKCNKWPREYFKYGQDEGSESFDVVIHARAETKYGQTAWNYPTAWFSKALKILDINPMHCASIGSLNGAAHVPRTRDLRGAPLDVLAEILANSKVCVGSSSGPMHYAHLCGCPIVVITTNEYQKSVGGTNKARYTKTWRAWDTPVKVLDKHNWRTPPEKVAKAIGKILCV